MGEVREVCPRGGGARLVIEVPEGVMPGDDLGDSLAVNGCCLTVAGRDGPRLSFDLLQETLDLTNLGRLTAGSRVNLEPALAWGDPLGGHLVSGHIDGVGEVTEVRPVGDDWRATLRAPDPVLDALVHKGSVACDGISLTVARLTPDGFEVHLIPHTMQVTIASDWAPGVAVNLEADLVAKLVRRLVDRGASPAGWTWDGLREAGLPTHG